MLATFFGCGLSPKAPGTVATFAAALPFLLPIPAAVHGPLCLVLAVVSYVACVAVARRLFGASVNESDPGWFTLDEACGLWIAAWRPHGISLPSLAVAVAAFRFLDIVKPFPIRQLQDVRGGHGIVLDDAVAGLGALGLGLLFDAWFSATPW